MAALKNYDTYFIIAKLYFQFISKSNHHIIIIDANSVVVVVIIIIISDTLVIITVRNFIGFTILITIIILVLTFFLNYLIFSFPKWKLTSFIPLSQFSIIVINLVPNYSYHINYSIMMLINYYTQQYLPNFDQKNFLIVQPHFCFHATHFLMNVIVLSNLKAS